MKVSHVGQLFNLTIGVVEVIQQLYYDVLDEKGQMLESELEVSFSEFAQNVQGLH